MTEATTLSFRCPADILDAIRQVMTATGTRQSTVITDALRVGLGLADAGPVGEALESGRALQGITDRITDLEGTVRQHDQLVGDVEKLKQRVRVVEDRVRFKAPGPEVERPPLAVEVAAPVGDRQNKQSLASEPPAAGRLTVRQAFEALGGDRSNPDSKVSSLTGTKRVKWHTFRLAEQTDYSLFGFEVDRKYRDANPGKPDWLVPATTTATAQAPTLFSLEGL